MQVTVEWSILLVNQKKNFQLVFLSGQGCKENCFSCSSFQLNSVLLAWGVSMYQAQGKRNLEQWGLMCFHHYSWTNKTPTGRSCTKQSRHLFPGTTGNIDTKLLICFFGGVFSAFYYSYLISVLNEDVASIHQQKCNIKDFR